MNKNKPWKENTYSHRLAVQLVKCSNCRAEKGFPCIDLDPRSWTYKKPTRSAHRVRFQILKEIPLVDRKAALVVSPILWKWVGLTVEQEKLLIGIDSDFKKRKEIVAEIKVIPEVILEYIGNSVSGGERFGTFDPGLQMLCEIYDVDEKSLGGVIQTVQMWF